MAGKKKKAKRDQVALKDNAQPGGKHARSGKKPLTRTQAREQIDAVNSERRAKKLEKRRQERNVITAEMWAQPVPSHLVAKLAAPKITSKHKTYFEIADNHEKKKKLEYTVTNNRHPPPGFTFVAVGDPEFTKACKELSRERDAMIFIVSDTREDNSKIAQHVRRAGYHFREVIVEDARRKLGGRVISKAAVGPGFIEPIPESQEAINEQADKAIRDLFPRIPHTDREMIIMHAFRKGGTFQGEPMVGTQADIPLSRRVQLATLAHIRHVHTRYDLLLRETTWMNARKAVEPVCLDILMKWRGDEETGRDQMDDILREVVVISDSEGDEESSEYEDEDEDESSDEEEYEEDEINTSSSRDSSVEIISINQLNPTQCQQNAATVAEDSKGRGEAAKASRTIPVTAKAREHVVRDKNSQKGFKRYQAAYDDAKARQRQQNASELFTQPQPIADMRSGQPISYPNMASYGAQPLKNGDSRTQRPYEYNDSEGFHGQAEFGQPYSMPRPTSTGVLRRDEVTTRPLSENMPYAQGTRPQFRAYSPRPPQVMGGSPTHNRLQDLLVPSIETGPSEFPSSSHMVERSDFRSEREKFYSHHASERAGNVPVGRQVIIIDDDSSPESKRHRVLHENSGPLRVAPSLSRSNMHPERLKSPRSRAPTQPGEIFTSHSRAPPQAAQGLYQGIPDQRERSFAQEKLPIYDAPSAGFFAAHPRQLGMQEVECQGSSSYRGRPQYGGNVPSKSHRDTEHPNRLNDEVHRTYTTVGESYQGALPASDYDATGRVGRMSPHVPAVDQHFVHSFSQSRLGKASQPGDGLYAPRERAQPPISNQGVPRKPTYEDTSLGSASTPNNQPLRYDSPSFTAFVPAPPLRPRSPVDSMEKPSQYWDERQNRPFYGQRLEGHSAVSIPQPRPQGYQAQEPELPTFVRTVDPKRRNIGNFD